jgi:hypothetical protein
MDHSEPIDGAGAESPTTRAVEDVKGAIATLLSALERLDEALAKPESEGVNVAAVMDYAPDPSPAGWSSPEPETQTDETPWAQVPAESPDTVEPAHDEIIANPGEAWTTGGAKADWSAWQEPGGGLEPGSWPFGRSAESAQGDSSSAAREEVRRAVEQMRAELGGDTDRGAQPPREADVSNGESWRDAAHYETPDGREEVSTVSDIVAPRADAGEHEPPEELASPQSDVDVREQVRKAVEAAKAELEGDATQPTRAPAPSIAEAFDSESLRIPHHEPVFDERSLQPALLVIDDPEGRVELVRVYRTLARLDVAASANLANYSSHSVTVQLEERKLPDLQEISGAVGYAFERECTVDIDGNRANVRLFGSRTRVA